MGLHQCNTEEEASRRLLEAAVVFSKAGFHSIPPSVPSLPSPSVKWSCRSSCRPRSCLTRAARAAAVAGLRCRLVAWVAAMLASCPRWSRLPDLLLLLRVDTQASIERRRRRRHEERRRSTKYCDVGSGSAHFEAIRARRARKRAQHLRQVGAVRSRKGRANHGTKNATTLPTTIPHALYPKQPPGCPGSFGHRANRVSECRTLPPPRAMRR